MMPGREGARRADTGGGWAVGHWSIFRAADRAGTEAAAQARWGDGRGTRIVRWNDRAGQRKSTCARQTRIALTVGCTMGNIDRMIPTRLARLFVLLVAFVVQFSAGRASAATTLYVYKASLTLPATMVIVRNNMPTDLIVTRKLGTKDVINLALGRPLGSKVDSKTEILAAAVTFEPPSQAPLAKVIVFDPSQNGLAQITTVVATLSSLDYQTAYLSSKSQGLGISTAQMQPTTIGDFAHNGLLASTLTGGGVQSGAHILGGNSNPKLSHKSSFQGRIKFVTTENNVTSTFDGFVVGGQFKFSGGFIGTFDQ